MNLNTKKCSPIAHKQSVGEKRIFTRSGSHREIEFTQT